MKKRRCDFLPNATKVSTPRHYDTQREERTLQTSWYVRYVYRFRSKSFSAH
jgi:hypothetical protein